MEKLTETTKLRHWTVVINSIIDEFDTTVQVKSQSFTDTQKKQARTNIGVPECDNKSIVLSNNQLSVSDSWIKQTIADNVKEPTNYDNETIVLDEEGNMSVSASWLKTQILNSVKDILKNAISSDAGNAITLGTDGKLKVIVVSADIGNLIETGSDKGAYTPYDYGTI